MRDLDISLPHSDKPDEDVAEEPEDGDSDSYDKQAAAEAIEEPQGRASDRSTFKYYLASVTWLNIIPAGLYIILHTFFYMFRCKSKMRS